MQMIKTNRIHTHVRVQGPADGQPVLFSNSLGTDLRIWDAVLDLLPPGLRTIRYDTRGHGLTDCPPAPYHMQDLVADAAAVLDALKVADAVVVGLSIGGLIAQGLAAERPDLTRALVLCDTAAKIGNDDLWDMRIRTVRESGVAALADGILERWFSRQFRRTRQAELAAWRNMLVRTPAQGYMGCAAAIAETDLLESTSRLRLPVLAVAGSEDGATPPDLVRETAALIPGAQFHVIKGAGHLPCLDTPDVLATHIAGLLDRLEG